METIDFTKVKNSYLTAWHKYKDFNGTADLYEFWSFVLINFLVEMLLMLWLVVQAFAVGLPAWVSSMTNTSGSISQILHHPFTMGLSVMIPLILLASFELVMLLPTMAVVTRRLVDVGLSKSVSIAIAIIRVFCFKRLRLIIVLLSDVLALCPAQTINMNKPSNIKEEFDKKFKK